MRACTLVPAFNEEPFIGDVVRAALRSGPVWVVDDGSSDGTGARAAEAGASLLRHPVRLGKGAALRTGFAELAGRFEAIVTLDGDLQHDPGEVPRLLAGLRRADLVVGRRRRTGTLMPRLRRLSNGYSSFLLSILTRRFLPDVHCGFRAYRTAMLREIEIRSNGFEIEVELILKAARGGWRIGDCPVRTLYGRERSKIAPVGDALQFLRAAAVYGLGLDL